MKLATLKAYHFYRKQGKPEIAQHILASTVKILKRNRLIAGYFTGRKSNVIHLECEWCGCLPKNHEEVMQLNNIGVCADCLREDHVMADVLDQQRMEVAECL